MNQSRALITLPSLTFEQGNLARLKILDICLAGVEVTAIGVTETGSHLLIGDAEGELLWFKMQWHMLTFFQKNQRFQFSPILFLEYLIILEDLWEKSVANIRTKLVVRSLVYAPQTDWTKCNWNFINASLSRHLNAENYF